MTQIPEWLEPIRRAAQEITVRELTRFSPPPGVRTKRGGVLMLFGEGERGPDLLLTERAHDMRSHPGQVSFPGGRVEKYDASPVEAALREAQEEIGLDPAGVEVFGTLPDLWLPPSNFSVTVVLGWWARPSPVGVMDPAEVHAVYHEPIEELLDPAHRFTVVGPVGYKSPGFGIGHDKDLILWGFTAGVVSRLFDFVGWTRPWDASVERQLPDHMLWGRRRGRRDEVVDRPVPDQPGPDADPRGTR